ncbi:MAG: hypothetical protein IKO01_09990 [Kiritimatiellae bacterium]|nr:hypothetical protein [Kiritimatiellia bacterium]
MPPIPQNTTLRKERDTARERLRFPCQVVPTASPPPSCPLPLPDHPAAPPAPPAYTLRGASAASRTGGRRGHRRAPRRTWRLCGLDHPAATASTTGDDDSDDGGDLGRTGPHPIRQRRPTEGGSFEGEVLDLDGDGDGDDHRHRHPAPSTLRRGGWEDGGGDFDLLDHKGDDRGGKGGDRPGPGSGPIEGGEGREAGRGETRATDRHRDRPAPGPGVLRRKVRGCAVPPHRQPPTAQQVCAEFILSPL